VGEGPADRQVVADPRLVLEPLVGNYLAWVQLVSPIPSALRLAFSQLPTMESFLDAPQAHASGAGHPATRGGPFVDCRDEDFASMQEFTRRLAGRTDLVELADQVRQLDQLLESGADGFDLTGMYARVPERLRGYVELLYDTHNRPRLRFREALLYQSPYATTTREGVHLTLALDDERPFMLSTPRLSTSRGVVADVALDDQALDLVSRSRSAPVRYGEIVERLGLRGDDEVLFREFWTPQEATAPRSPYAGPTRARYFGHACVLLESDATTILVDPFISPQPGADRFSLADLPDRIDYCIITHGHADHFVLETLLAIRHKLGVVVVPKNMPGELLDPSLRLCLEHVGIREVVEVSDGDTIPVPDGEIVALPFSGEHGDLPIAAKTTYLVRLADRTVLMGADTRGGHPALHQLLRRAYGPVDDVFLGMECQGAPMGWMYGPLFSGPIDRKINLSRRLNGSNADEALELIDSLGARRVFVYAMGEEPWLQHVMATNYTPDSYQLEQIGLFGAACTERSIEFRHLVGKAELPFGGL
jgi:L-ascorbate metabolism protein UlaG (beta-lactamase superfamily)